VDLKRRQFSVAEAAVQLEKIMLRIYAQRSSAGASVCVGNGII
jgi:hypothetical protein